MENIDHKCRVLGFTVLDSVIKCKMWKFTNTVTFQFLFVIAVKADHLKARKHMSDFGHRSIRES